MTTPHRPAPLTPAPSGPGSPAAARRTSHVARRAPPDFEAAGILPVHPSGAVLLHLRDDRPDVGSPNRWGMLGGMLEPGESPRDAALRELDEEAGVRPPALLTFAVDDHPSLRRPGKTVRSHVFAAAVDWSLDDLTLGEGQAIDWFMPAEVPALSLVLPLAPLILRFLASDLYARLAGDGAAQRPALAGPLPPELPAALGLRPGHLLAVRGLSAGFVCRLRDVLDGVRVTASPAAEERPDVILWRPRGEDVAPALGAWRDRMAPNGVLWLLDPAGSDATLTAARGAGFALSVRVLPGGLRAVRLQPLR